MCVNGYALKTRDETDYKLAAHILSVLFPTSYLKHIHFPNVKRLSSLFQGLSGD